MAEPREKFAMQIDPRILAEVRRLAQGEGRQIQALVEAALGDLIEKRRSRQSRPRVMTAYRTSLGLYKELYKKRAQ